MLCCRTRQTGRSSDKTASSARPVVMTDAVRSQSVGASDHQPLRPLHIPSMLPSTAPTGVHGQGQG